VLRRVSVTRRAPKLPGLGLAPTSATERASSIASIGDLVMEGSTAVLAVTSPAG
jgi:hypothetical protein